ncbi:hypothetical protein J5295_05805 [Riemerella anatipestifer]|uniref:Uncharacterized protein n=2 Tax=Riemerella anatipestifer TaxID=34085 RepID=A0AAP6HG06_RIEAN|nr:hypothetical protein [Riemerella anatipestifer]ADQ81310.1 hypothetical protein Riean_0135 [Riemerella anatipestifer ATCC 11845 = DSM 15868]ADZ11207.1 hypothetical protein RIA_0004 [Riemerella anatipestifer RA-GD]AGC40797.1 hypothetical protein G148_1493 [Riemerella anatipestifer RA-CH-2]AKP68615.1 hypothetical protein CG08_0148 [Riemerella anatipestifer]AKP70436.1 hypothetical protein CG09_0140 [Riemerella anatipestifer]
MRTLVFVISFWVANLSAQVLIPIDEEVLKSVQDIFIDDYENIYLYQNNDFSFTKYNTQGQKQGRMMMVFPFKVQSVQNPLNIVLFSENQQEIKMLDQNLNEIQSLKPSQSASYISHLYMENLQLMWLLNPMSKTLLQYHFRENRLLNSFVLDIDFNDIKDFIVDNGFLYYLQNDYLIKISLISKKVQKMEVSFARKLRREGNSIFVITNTSVIEFQEDKLKTVFSEPKAQIVEKNNNGYLALIGDKLYLYELF